MNLEALKTVNAADVYVAGQFAGTLTKEAGSHTTFTYDPNYRGRPVASTLQVGPAPVTAHGGAVPPFFAGLLPEGYRLSLLQKDVKTSLNDEFSLLLAIGQDTPGNVQVVPSGTPLTSVASSITGDPSTLDFSHIFSTVDRHGLPGVQAKASAYMLTAPVASQTGAALVKISPKAYPHLIRNEYQHLLAAKKLRLPTVRASLVKDRHGTEGLWIQRFDRQEERRIAFEDATQILNVHPAQKYTLTTESVIQALSELSASPLVTTRNLYLQFVFAWLTGNGDLHGKNVGLLENIRGTWEVAPIYDIPCTLVYGDDSLALPVAGRTKRLRRQHWFELAEGIGLHKKAALSAHRLALTAAAAVDWDSIGLEGSSLRGAQRELRFRRYELDPL